MRLTRKEFLGVVAGAAAGAAVASTLRVEEAAAAQGTAAAKPKKLEGAAIKGATEAVKNSSPRPRCRSIPADASSRRSAA